MELRLLQYPQRMQPQVYKRDKAKKNPQLSNPLVERMTTTYKHQICFSAQYEHSLFIKELTWSRH